MKSPTSNAETYVMTTKGEMKVIRSKWYCLILLSVSMLILAISGAFAQDTNLALTATATASSELGSGNAATCVNDNNTITFWAPVTGQEEGSYIQLQWASEVTFSKVVVNQIDNAIGTVSVEVLKGTSWQTISGCGINKSGNNVEIEVGCVSASGLRITMSNIDTISSFGISEVQVYMGDINLAKLAKATSSGSHSSYGWGVTGLNDGTYSNDAAWWADQSVFGVVGRWIQYSWGSPQTINKIIARLGSSGGDDYRTYGSRSYRLQASLDGYNWTDVKSGGSIRKITNGTGILTVLLPQAITCKYLRLNVANENMWTIIIPEFETWYVQNPNWATISGKITDATSSTGIGCAQLEATVDTGNANWKEENTPKRALPLLNYWWL